MPVKCCLLLFAALLAAACGSIAPTPLPPDPGPPDAAPAPDAGPVDENCAQLQVMLAPGGLERDGCWTEDGKPLWERKQGSKTVQFADVCREQAGEMGWDIECALLVTACSQINAALQGSCDWPHPDSQQVRQ